MYKYMKQLVCYIVLCCALSCHFMLCHFMACCVLTHLYPPMRDKPCGILIFCMLVKAGRKSEEMAALANKKVEGEAPPPLPVCDFAACAMSGIGNVYYVDIYCKA